jgi:uncharacterized damage-inducible protein DinB
VTTRTLASAFAIVAATTAGAQTQQATPAPAQPAQQTQPAQTGPLTAGAKRTYDIIKNYVTKAAAKMPDEHYAFKPTPEVRSFGQLVGHIADANFGFCSAALAEKAPMGGFDPSTSLEKTKTTKADLEKALADSFAYCDKAHAAMNDAAGAALVKFFSGEMAKLSVLEFNTHHDFEHYGNMVTYMRLKGLVPPSSEPRGSR